MNKHIKTIPWIIAFVAALSFIAPVNAHERGNGGYYNDRGVEIVFAGTGYGYPDYGYQQPRGRNNTVYYQQGRGNQYAYGRPYFAKQKSER